METTGLSTTLQGGTSYDVAGELVRFYVFGRTETARAQRINDKVLRHSNTTITSTPDLSKNGCHSKSKLPKLPLVTYYSGDIIFKDNTLRTR